MTYATGGVFDLQKSLSSMGGFPWAKYKGEFHVTPSYNYLGPGTRLDERLDENLQPKSGEYPVDAVDTAALAHDIRYLQAEQKSTDQEVLDEKHNADAIMINELAKINPTCFRESFAKWIADKALKLKLKLGMKLNPLSGKPMDPIYSNAMANFLIDLEVMNAQKAHKLDPTNFPETYVNEITQNAEKIKSILGGTINNADNVDNVDSVDPDINALVDKYFNEYKKDVKEYDDYKAEEERKAREVSFIEKLIEIIEKPMKFITNYTFGQIPYLRDFLTYDKLKGLITDGSKSKWELREEADTLDEAIKSVDTKIDELLKQGHVNSPDLQKLYDAVAPLRQQRREYKKLLGFGLPVLKGIHHKLAQELHSPIVRKFTRRSVFLNALDETWSADLIIMPKPDSMYKNILLCIDNFSKYIWVIPLKTKTAKELVEAFESIVTSSNRKPKKIWFDKESGIYSVIFQEWCLKNKIVLYSTNSELKACIAERAIRTIKEKMWRKFTEVDNEDSMKHWVTILPTVVDEYNNTTHSSHRMTPIDASKPENEVEVKKRLNAKMLKYSSKPAKYKIGDKVRIYSYKYTFDKGYKKNYTEEIFEIHLVHSTVPWTYSIKDATGEVIVGKFYENEMIHSDFDFGNKLKVNKVYNF